MPLLPFQGTAWALSGDGLAAVASKLGVFAPGIWAVLVVETSGCGYLPDRRPQILYERHIFHRVTNGSVRRWRYQRSFFRRLRRQRRASVRPCREDDFISLSIVEISFASAV